MLKNQLRKRLKIRKLKKNSNRTRNLGNTNHTTVWSDSKVKKEKVKDTERLFNTKTLNIVMIHTKVDIHKSYKLMTVIKATYTVKIKYIMMIIFKTTIAIKQMMKEVLI